MNILFVCTGNTCRSAMAQAYFNSRAQFFQSQVDRCQERQNEMYADSAGIAAFEGQAATKDAIDAMETLYHIDLSGHQSKQVTSALIEKADLVLAMTGMHKKILQENYPDSSGKIYTLGEYSHRDAPEQPYPSLDIPDPYGWGEAEYQKTAQRIARQIDRIIGWNRRQTENTKTADTENNA